VADPAASEVTVREATAADNDALIRLELECPLEMGDIAETYDRSPDFFACHRQKETCRVVVGEIDGQIVGVTTGSIQQPSITGELRKIMYVQQARVHPDFQGRKVAWFMSNHLFAWARDEAATAGPYYLISPKNAPSIAFVERGGGRWPIDVSIISIDVAGATDEPPELLGEDRLAEATDLINATHAGEDFFAPLAIETLRKRSRWAPLNGVVEGDALVAVAGLWDRGLATARIQRNSAAGTESMTREAAVTDWGWKSGFDEAFAGLVAGLAAKACDMGRDALTICEPRPGALPPAGLPHRTASIALFTPALPPPAPDAIKGIFVDMLYI